MFMIWFCFKNTEAQMCVKVPDTNTARKLWDTLSKTFHMISERP